MEIARFLRVNANGRKPSSSETVISISSTRNLTLHVRMVGAAMDSISATVMGRLSSSIRRTHIDSRWAQLSLLASISFMAILWCFLSPASAAASDAKTGRDAAPIWGLNVKALGYAPSQRAQDEGVYIPLGIEPICFLANGEIVLSFVTRETPTGLPHRGEHDEILPFRLHAIFVNQNTGHVRATKEWPVSSTRSRILPVTDGNFVVFAPDQLLLYSPQLGLVKQLDLSLGQMAVKDNWYATPSSGGKYLLLDYEPAEDAKRVDRMPMAQLLAEPIKDHLDWIDLQSLQIVAAWTVKIAPDSFYEFGDISDQGLVQLWTYGARGYEDAQIVKIGKPPNGPWHSMCQPAESYCRAGKFINNETVLAFRYENSRTDVRVWIGVISTKGSLLFDETFPSKEILRGGVPASMSGGSFALGILKGKGGSRFLDIAAHYSMDRVVVFDVAARRWIYTLDAKKHNIKELSGMALSPDGSLLAIINQDGILEVYQIPGAPQPTHN